LATASDTQLLQWVAEAGDREAFKALVRRRTESLVRMAFDMVHPSLTDDLVQETLYRAWRYRHTYRAEAQPLTWLRVIMHHASTGPAFRLTPGTEVTDLDLLDDLEGSDDLQSVLEAEAIECALGKLKPEEADVVRRRHIGGQEWATIVQETAFHTEYYAKKTYGAALTKLARLLTD